MVELDPILWSGAVHGWSCCLLTREKWGFGVNVCVFFCVSVRFAFFSREGACCHLQFVILRNCLWCGFVGAFWIGQLGDAAFMLFIWLAPKRVLFSMHLTGTNYQYEHESHTTGCTEGRMIV